MRIGKVVGRVTLSPIHESLVGGRFLIVGGNDVVYLGVVKDGRSLLRV